MGSSVHTTHVSQCQHFECEEIGAVWNETGARVPKKASHTRGYVDDPTMPQPLTSTRVVWAASGNLDRFSPDPPKILG